jgi:hypothetical protein
VFLLLKLLPVLGKSVGHALRDSRVAGMAEVAIKTMSTAARVACDKFVTRLLAAEGVSDRTRIAQLHRNPASQLL